MERLAAMGRDFDLVIVGGGIIGCGIARDAALRGLRVAIFDRRDFGAGTTAASTRIVHGGLRYLQMLDFKLVRMDLRERETLLRIAPHLVKPLEFVIPIYRRDLATALKLRAGLALYDALSAGNTLPRRRWMNAAGAQPLLPVLHSTNIRQAAAYYDARVDSPERLALENIIDAEAHGAQALNYCEVVGIRTERGRVTAVQVRDTMDATEASVTARAVVNATGAWFDTVAPNLGGHWPASIRKTKGVHIVLPALTKHALVIFSAIDKRLMFAIPRHGLTWIGTTDTDYAGDPADARATRADVEYLIGSVDHVFPTIRISDVLYTTAGIRALVRHRGAESSVSRMHKIVSGPPIGAQGVISVLGGKITGYRAIAEEAVDAACRYLGVRDRVSTTAERPLPGAGSLSMDMSEEQIPSHLSDLYGSRAAAVASLARSAAGLERPLSPKYPDIAAQVVFAVRHERCVRLSDFLRRRTLLGATADQGLDAALPAATLMGAELGWSTQRIDEEVDGYRRDVDRTESFRSE
jgi:glycerol-3-phosphate dehydrogenase